MTDHALRPPRPDEARAWVELKNASWRAAYGHLYDPEFFDALDARAGQDSRRWKELFEGLDSSGGAVCDGVRRRFLAAFVEDAGGSRMVGLGGTAAPGDVGLLELTLLYAAPEHWGTGVGRALMRELLGDRPASLWVFEDNPRARRTYARQGFRPDGAQRTEEVPGQPAHPAVRLVRDPR